jgi:LytS/YehU family sensor histidine kinase
MASLPETAQPMSASAVTSAFAATLQRLRTGVWRNVVVVGGICLGIAALLTALDGGRFGVKLTYSVAIASICVLVVDVVRLFAAWATDVLRARRGLQHTEVDLATVGWRGAIPGALLSMLIGPPVGLWIGDQLTGYTSPSLLHFGTTATRVTLTLSAIATVISVVVISTLERLHHARAQAEAAQRQAAENQLRLLQSQLEPHMLFNTLANLRVLIGLDPPQAQAMLDRLIAFLRATLNASRTTAHPLATEFDRLADYLALMGTRMGPRLQSTLDLPDALRHLPVPPLLLQPLVENAIKHGLEPHVQGGRVEVRARAEGQTLVLTVRDTGAGLRDGTPPEGTRFGLVQVRERLSTLHGTAASLNLAPADDTEGGTLATIRLPLKAATA